MEQNNSSKPARKKLSGAARRTRAKLLRKSDERSYPAAVNPTRKDSGSRRRNSNGLRGVSRNDPASISKKSKSAVNKPISNQTFEFVRQKLVSSLMQFLPQTSAQGANWNNGDNQSALVPYNSPNNSNNMSMPTSWNSNKSNIMNRMSSAWNNNNSNNNNSGCTNNLNQGYWSNNNNNRMRAVPSNAWATEPSVPEWNNSNNMNQSAPTHMSRGWSDQCPAPPAWGNATNNPPEISNSGRFDSMVVANDPRNAGGREYFQDQLAGDRGDDSYNFDSSLNASADFNDSSDELKFVIMDVNMPRGRISQPRRQEIFTRAFNQAVADLILSADSRFPPIQIKVSRFIQDLYKIVVTSQSCVEVLQNLVDGLPELWPGSKFRLVPLQKRTKHQKATLFLRSGAIGRSSEEILLILKRQNTGLNTDLWEIYFRKEQSDGVLFILGVDRQSVEYVDSVRGRVYFLTSTAVFRIGNSKRSKSSNSTK